MKKISIILTLLLVSCTYTFKDIKAEGQVQQEGFPQGMLQAVPVPVYCAPTFEILTAVMQTFNMKYVASGDVRTGGLIQGDLIGTTSFWYNEKTNTGIFFMTMASTGLTCMMSYGINFKFEEEMMLNIINEEMK